MILKRLTCKNYNFMLIIWPDAYLSGYMRVQDPCTVKNVRGSGHFRKGLPRILRLDMELNPWN